MYKVKTSEALNVHVLIQLWRFCVPHHCIFFYCYCCSICLQCFGAVGWATGTASGLQKTEWWGAGVVICLKRGADLHMAQLIPLPLTVSCFSKIQIGFTFLVPAHPGSLRPKAVKRVCVLLLQYQLVDNPS